MDVLPAVGFLSAIVATKAEPKEGGHWILEFPIVLGPKRKVQNVSALAPGKCSFKISFYKFNCSIKSAQAAIIFATLTMK